MSGLNSTKQAGSEKVKFVFVKLDQKTKQLRSATFETLPSKQMASLLDIGEEQNMEVWAVDAKYFIYINNGGPVRGKKSTPMKLPICARPIYGPAIVSKYDKTEFSQEELSFLCSKK